MLVNYDLYINYSYAQAYCHACSTLQMCTRKPLAALDREDLCPLARRERCRYSVSVLAQQPQLALDTTGDSVGIVEEIVTGDID